MASEGGGGEFHMRVILELVDSTILGFVGTGSPIYMCKRN